MTSMPTFGLRVHGGMTPRACIEMAERAEAAGLASLWFAENPFTRGVLPAVAGSLLKTKTLKVGIGVFNPYNRHPTLIAMEMAALDELAEGRAMLGIGSGIGTAIERMGLSYAKPLAAVRDGVEIVRAMLRGDSVTYSGNAFSVRDVKLEFPAPRPDMPIYVAAMGDQALNVTGQVADGLMISNMCPPGFTSRAIGLMAAGAAKAGRPVPTVIIQYVPCCVRSDGAEARQVVKGAIGGMLSAYWRMGERWPAVREAMARESGIPEADIVGAIDRIGGGEAAAEVLDDRFVAAFALAGTPDEILEGAARYAEVGVTELVFTMIGQQPAQDLATLSAVLKRAA